MGLRDFLQGAEQFKSGLQEYGQSSSAQALRDELPSLIEQIRSGDPRAQEEAAARYYDLQGRSGGKGGALDPQIAQSLFANLQNKKQVTPAQAIEDLQAGYGDAKPEQLEFAAKLPTFEEQHKYLSERAVGTRAGTNVNIRVGEQEQKQSTKSFDVLNKTKDAFRSDDYQLKEILDSVDKKTALDDSIVFNYVARSVSKEKGPLSDGDITRLQGITGFQGTKEEFLSRFTGEAYSKLSDEQRKSVKAVVLRSAANFKARMADSFAQDLNDLYNSQAKMRDKDGNPKGIIASTLKELKEQGVPVEFDSENKAFIVKKKMAETKTGPEASLLQSAAATKDMNLMSSIAKGIAAIRKQGREPTPEELEKLQALVNSRKK